MKSWNRKKQANFGHGFFEFCLYYFSKEENETQFPIYQVYFEIDQPNRNFTTSLSSQDAWQPGVKSLYFIQIIIKHLVGFIVFPKVLTRVEGVSEQQWNKLTQIFWNILNLLINNKQVYNYQKVTGMLCTLVYYC